MLGGRRSQGGMDEKIDGRGFNLRDFARWASRMGRENLVRGIIEESVGGDIMLSNMKS